MTSKEKLKWIEHEFTDLDLDRHDSRVIAIWYEVVDAALYLDTKQEITKLIEDHLALRGLK